MMVMIDPINLRQNTKMAVKNQEDVKWTFFHLKINWNANYQAKFQLFLDAKCWILA
jgi:hypothetical protein